MLRSPTKASAQKSDETEREVMLRAAMRQLRVEKEQTEKKLKEVFSQLSYVLRTKEAAECISLKSSAEEWEKSALLTTDQEQLVDIIVELRETNSRLSREVGDLRFRKERLDRLIATLEFSVRNVITNTIEGGKNPLQRLCQFFSPGAFSAIYEENNKLQVFPLVPTPAGSLRALDAPNIRFSTLEDLLSAAEGLLPYAVHVTEFVRACDVEVYALCSSSLRFSYPMAGSFSRADIGCD